MIVMSSPSLRIIPLPIGTVKSSSEISEEASIPPDSDLAPFEPYNNLCSKISTGSSSLTAAFSNPYAS